MDKSKADIRALETIVATGAPLRFGQKLSGVALLYASLDVGAKDELEVQYNDHSSSGRVSAETSFQIVINNPLCYSATEVAQTQHVLTTMLENDKKPR